MDEDPEEPDPEISEDHDEPEKKVKHSYDIEFINENEVKKGIISEELLTKTCVNPDCVILESPKNSERIFVDLRAIAKKSEFIRILLTKRMEEESFSEPYCIKYGTMHSWIILYGMFLNPRRIITIYEDDSLINYAKLCEFLLLDSSFIAPQLRNYISYHNHQKVPIEYIVNILKKINVKYVKDYISSRHMFSDGKVTKPGLCQIAELLGFYDVLYEQLKKSLDD